MVGTSSSERMIRLRHGSWKARKASPKASREGRASTAEHSKSQTGEGVQEDPGMKKPASLGWRRKGTDQKGSSKEEMKTGDTSILDTRKGTQSNAIPIILTKEMRCCNSLINL